MPGEMSKEKQEELQRKYMELQTTSQKMQQMQKQIQVIGEQIQELNITKDSLEDISKTEEGTEIKAPLASGIFIKAKLLDNKDVSVNVGSGTVVTKSIPEAKKLVDRQIEEITSFRKDTEEKLNKIASDAQGLENELSELVK